MWKSRKAKTGGKEAQSLPALDEQKEHLIVNDKGLQDLATRLQNMEPRQEEQRIDSSHMDAQTDSTHTPVLLPIGYTKFTITGFKGVKHAIFIQDGQTLTPAVFQQICSALGKEAPAQFLCGVGPVKHTSRMSSRQLRTVADFRPQVVDAVQTLGLGDGAREEKPGLSSYFGGRQEINPEVVKMPQVAEMVNTVLEQKLEQSIAAVASAAQAANTWSCTGPRVTSFELFLQANVENSGAEKNLTRMVVSHLQDKAYMECNIAKSMLRELYEKSQPMSPQAVEKSSAVNLRGDLWNPKHNKDHKEFAKYGSKYWSFSTYEDPEMKGHPLMQFPWPSGDVFFFIYHTDQADGTPDSSLDWSYKTKTALEPRFPLPVENLAPLGYIFMGGKVPGIKKKLMSVLTAPSPSIFVDNTDGLTKQVCVLCKIIQAVNGPYPLTKCDKFLSESAQRDLGVRPSINQLLQAMMPSKMLTYIETEYDPSGMGADERLNMGDLVHILEQMKRRPLAFNQRLTTVDPFQDPRMASTKMSQMVSVLASHSMTAQECKNIAVGRALTLKGWRLHRKLAMKAVSTRRSFVAVSVAISVMIGLCTIFAVTIVALRIQKKKYDDVVYKVTTSLFFFKFDLNGILDMARVSMVFLPIIAGLLVTLQSHWQLSMRSASLQMSADQVVSDVNLFLGRVGPYTGDTKEAQRLFMRRLRDIVKRLSMAGVSEDGVLATGSRAEEQFPEDTEELEHHVESYVYSTGWTWVARRFKDCLAMTGCYSAPNFETHTLLEQADIVPDFAAEFTIEPYMELRFGKVRKFYQDRLTTLSRRRLALKAIMLAVLLLSSSLILALVSQGADVSQGLCLWIPVSVGLVTFALTIQRLHAPSESISVLSNALTVLSHIDLRWKAADLPQRRSPKMAKNIITTTEKVWCSVAMCLSGAVLFLDEPDEAVWEHETIGFSSRSKMSGKSKRGLSSRPMSRSMSLASTPTDLISVMDVESQMGG